MSSPANSIRDEGYVILRGVLGRSDVNNALERCLSEWPPRPLWFGGGTIIGHIAYTPPPDLELLAQLVTNPSVVRCVSEVLGGDFHLLSFGCNVNLPGSGYQPAHTDGGMGLEHLGLSLPLGDVTESNGSLEVFCRTHRRTLTYTEFMRERRDDIARRANTCSGDVIIRYLNVWHRGTPNYSAAPRFMIAALVGRPAPGSTPLRLSPDNIESIKRAGVRAEMTGTDLRTGLFHPTYFPRTPKGITRELICRYAPGVYSLARLIPDLVSR